MIEKATIDRQTIALVNDCFLIHDKTVKYKEPNPYVVAVCYDLATNFRTVLSTEYLDKISEEEAIEYYQGTIKNLIELQSNMGKKELQPYFPKLIKVAYPKNYYDLYRVTLEKANNGGNYGAILGKSPLKCLKVKTHEEFKEYILEKKSKNRYDFMYLNSFIDWSPLSKLLYHVYANTSYFPTLYPTENINYDTINLKLTREDRRYILGELNNPKYKPEDIDKRDVCYWNKLTRVLHPEEPKYKTKYPHAYNLLFGIRNKSLEENKKPKGKNCPKLHNIMTAAWKKGEEFEALESWSSRSDLGLREILEEIRHYEVSPRVDPYRRFNVYSKGTRKVLLGERIIGKKIPSDFDREMASEIKIGLKQLFLSRLSEISHKGYNIPEFYRTIPATYILKGRLKFSEKISATKIRIACDCKRYSASLSAVLGDMNGKYVSTLDYLRFRRTDLIIGRESGSLFETLLIDGIGNGRIYEEGYRYVIVLCKTDDPGIKLSVMDCKTNGIIISQEKVGKSVIAFIVDTETNLLYWINESTKYFFNGGISKLNDNFEYIIDLLCKPKTTEPDFLSLYDVCEKLYGESVVGGKELGIYKVLSDMETIL